MRNFNRTTDWKILVSRFSNFLQWKASCVNIVHVWAVLRTTPTFCTIFCGCRVVCVGMPIVLWVSFITENLLLNKCARICLYSAWHLASQKLGKPRYRGFEVAWQSKNHAYINFQLAWQSKNHVCMALRLARNWKATHAWVFDCQATSKWFWGCLITTTLRMCYEFL